MQKIRPCLWFDDNAEEAVNFYTSIFKNSKIDDVSRYGEAGAQISGRARGSVMSLTFQLDGREFMALNGGPMFSFSPAISFVVSCTDQEEIDNLFQRLAEGGLILMPLGEYPFSKQFGWLVDKFGVSWQLNLGRRTQSITPSLMFVGANYGKAEEAMNFYVSQFKNSRIINLERYVPGEPEPVGTVKHATFSLNGEEFMAMDSNGVHPFTFTPAISFFTNCATQEEVDELWDNLSQDGEKSRCGWLADKYGISWQIVPSVLGQILQENNHEKSERVMKALFQMEKLDVKGLVQAAGALHS